MASVAGAALHTAFMLGADQGCSEDRSRKYKTAIDLFLKAGGPAPARAKTVERGHTPGSTLGWHLIEASDLALVAGHIADWADFVEIEVYPVIEDTEAGAAAKKASEE